MKTLFRLFVLFAICSVAIVSCNPKPKRIVSQTPIEKCILGVELESAPSQEEIEEAVGISIRMDDTSYVEENGPYLDVIVTTEMDSIPFWGFSWNHMTIHEVFGGAVCGVDFVSKFVTLEEAENQFDAVSAALKELYGEGNEENTEDVECSFWTDDTNSAGLQIYRDDTEEGDEQWVCQLYFVNIALLEQTEASH